MSWVLCTETVTSPAPSPGFMAATGLGPNEPCNAKCEIGLPADVMEVVCPYGHRFLATRSDIVWMGDA